MCFFKKKPAIITFRGQPDDLIWIYDASSDKQTVLVAEAPCEIVHIKNGAVLNAYESQKLTHTGAKNDIVKYYFVNVKMPCQTTWGTQSKLEYKDAATGRIVSIGANGVLSFYIHDSKKFVETIVGSRKSYTSQNLIDEMLSKIMDEFNDHLLAVITENEIEYAQMDGLLREIAQRLLGKLNDSLKKYGVHIEEFIIKQFVKPVELKDLSNREAEKKREFESTMLESDRKLEMLKKQQEIGKQQMQMNTDRAEHEISLKRMDAKFASDVEKMDYETKSSSYKELREMDREDIRVVADSEAKVREATKLPELTVINKGGKNEKGKCPHCDGEITENQIFCPTCRRKI